MIQVKEFLNYQEGQDIEVNKWLKENSDKIEVVDIKYSIGTFQEGCQEYSGILIVYSYR